MCCFQWHFSSVRSCELCCPFSGTAKLSKISSQSPWCPSGCGRTVETPRGCTALLSRSVPTSSGRGEALHLHHHQPPCTTSLIEHSSLLTEALTSPRAKREPSPEAVLELAGYEGGSKEVSAGRCRNEQDDGVSLAQTPRMLDKVEFFGRTSSHHSNLYHFHFCYICIYQNI